MLPQPSWSEHPCCSVWWKYLLHGNQTGWGWRRTPGILWRKVCPDAGDKSAKENIFQGERCVFHPLRLTTNCRLVSSVARALTCLPSRKTQVQSVTSWSKNQSLNNLVRSWRLWFKILSQFRWSHHWVVTLTKLLALYPSSFLINWKGAWRNEKNLKRVDVDLVVWSTFLMGEGTVTSLQWPCQKLASLRIIIVPVCNWLRDIRVINEILFFCTCEVHVHSMVGLTSYLHIASIHQLGEFGGVGGGTAIYGLYRCVPLWRVWFLSSSRERKFSSRYWEIWVIWVRVIKILLYYWLKILVFTRQTGNWHRKNAIGKFTCKFTCNSVL